MHQENKTYVVIIDEDIAFKMKYFDFSNNELVLECDKRIPFTMDEPLLKSEILVGDSDNNIEQTLYKYSNVHNIIRVLGEKEKEEEDNYKQRNEKCCSLFGNEDKIRPKDMLTKDESEHFLDTQNKIYNNYIKKIPRPKPKKKKRVKKRSKK